MVRLFFGNRSFVLLILPFIIGVFYACNAFTNYHGVESELSFGFWGSFAAPSHWSFSLIPPIIVMTNAVLINTLFNRNEFMERNNFLSSLIYVCLMSFFPSFYQLSGPAIAQLLLVLALFQVFKLNQNQDGRRHVFNAALLFGTACTLYPVLLVGTPFLFWAIWVIRPFVFRESMLVLLGFTIPLIYAGVYSAVFGIRFERTEFSSSSGELHYLDSIVLGAALMLLMLMSVKQFVNKLRVSSIRMKKLFRVLGLLTMLFAAIVVLEFFAFDKLAIGGLLIFPLSYFLPYAFGEKNLRPFPLIFFYLLLLFSVGKFFVEFNQFTV